jgi:hypothetical protein
LLVPFSIFIFADTMVAGLSANMSMRFFTFFTILFLFTTSLLAAPPASRFGGGMTGYFQYADIANGYGRMRGLAWGLGGLLHFNCTSHFRLGCMGSTYRLDYKSPGLPGSYVDMGYGGLTAECCIPTALGRFSLGAMAGGGGITSLHVLSRTPGDTVSAHYQSHGAMLASPILTYECPMTKSIALLARLEYLVALHGGNVSLFGSPGLRVGIIFNK